MNMKKLRYAILTLSLLSLLLYDCADFPSDIIMPQWNVELNVPLTNKIYSLYDMFEPESKYSLTTSIDGNDFYLIQSDNFKSNSDVTKYINLFNEESVSPAIVIPANIPEQSVYMSMPDGIEIEQATFEGGLLALKIDNPSNAEITSTLRIPAIRKPNGEELSIETSVPAYSSDSVSYDLSNHNYVYASEPSGENRGLQLFAAANSDVNGTYEYVTFYLSDFKFSAVQGYLPRLSLGNKRSTTSMELNDAADFRDKLFIDGGSLTLRSEYSSIHNNFFDFEIDNIKLIGMRNSGEEKYLERIDGQKLSFTLVDGAYNLVLDENNSNLVEFMTWMPDSLIITSEYILNPNNERELRTVTNVDSIKFSFKYSTKSIFALKKTSFVDTLGVDLSDADRDQISDGIRADLNIYLENAIPIDAYVKVTLTDENYSPLLTLTKNQNGVDSLQFLGAQINTATGQIISPSITNNIISLDSSQLSLLAVSRYIIISTTVNTTNAGNENHNPPTIQFKSSDWLNIKCFGKIDLSVNSDGGES